ncbi:MAG: right-handed parallel beta-helix repeat-containing protein [Caldilineaceae bacterium]
MRSIASSTRQGRRLMIAGGLAGVLLCALLLMMGGMPMSAAAAGNTICVGSAGDYATIQAAVDAAHDGDTILLAGITFEENVVITKSLNIEGRWLSDCSAKDTSPQGATVVYPESGRAFTIEPDQPGMSITVAIMDINATGNATGLGGADPVAQTPLVTQSVDNNLPISISLPIAAAGMAGDWRDQVVQLAAKGAIPGAPAADEIRARLAGPPERPEPPLQAAAAYRSTNDEVDCGGGLYAKNAGLQLENVLVSKSKASTTGEGYGGGVCIINPTADVYIADSQFNSNFASLTAFGAGGAMFIQGGDAAGVTIQDVYFTDNTAAPQYRGWGGGLAVLNAPHFKLTGSEDHCLVMTNLAGGAGNGLGGGVFLQGVADAEVSGCRFFNNYASGGSSVDPTTRTPATIGLGGGLFVEESPRIVVDDNKFDFNVAQTAAPQINGAASGGGVFVANSSQAAIGNNIFDRNTAGFTGTGRGGGLAVIKGDAYEDVVTGTGVFSNTFTRNWATVINFVGAAGGGFYAYGMADTAVTSNTFSANSANTMGEGAIQFMPAPFGGGLGLEHMLHAQVANNRFEGNVATVGGGGAGGGLGVRADKNKLTVGINIVDNLFAHNLGDSAMTGDAIGGAISVAQGQSITVAHNVLIENSGMLTTAVKPEKATTVIMLSGRSDTTAIANYVGLRHVLIDSNQILNSGHGLSATVTPPNNFAIGVQAADWFTITNNVIADSTLGGIVAVYESYQDDQSNPQETHGAIVNNTLYDNGTYGLWLLNRWRPDILQVTNNIVMGHKYGAEGINLYGAADPVLLDYPVLYDNEQDIGPEAQADGSITATHTLAADPLFFSPALDDYRLLPDSPAIDAGDPVGVPPAPPYDIDGGPRPYGPRVDIGAYEWQGQGYPFHFYLPGIKK